VARRVVIRSHLSPEHAARCSFTGSGTSYCRTDDLTEYGEHRGLLETEAKSVAYAFAGLVKFDTAAYLIGHVAGWSDPDADLICGTAARVVTAAHQVAAILTTDGDAAGVRQAAPPIATATRPLSHGCNRRPNGHPTPKPRRTAFTHITYERPARLDDEQTGLLQVRT
jgi:hypothetical protein